LTSTGKSSLLLRCKLQSNQHLSKEEKADLFLLAFFNMIFVGFFICCPVCEWMWSQVQATNRLTDADDWVWHRELLIKLPIHVLVTESSFYAAHYLLHFNPFLYQHIHKVHHRFKAPTAMTCVYAHPLEFALANVLPIYLGPMLTNAHPYTCYAWWTMAMLGTCKGHCGYRILNHADPHDEHHLFTTCNFGGMPLFDLILGTTYQKNKAVD
jgi:sterol desaturase/sphingolipid hydroxylase (fatty acid hydroxylase superfamily)